MEEKQHNQRKWAIIGSIFAGVLLLILIIANKNALSRWTDGFLRLLRPTLIGLVLAYLFNPIFRFFERKVFFRLRAPAFRRTVSMICTYLTVLLLISAIVLLIVPQLIESILEFVKEYKVKLAAVIDRINDALTAINGLIERFTGTTGFFEPLPDDAIQESLGKNFNLESLSNKFGELTQLLSAIASGLTDVIFAVFISVYMLASKEKRYAQVMKCRRALLGTKANAIITRICTVADRTFGGFVEGKLAGCLIVGIILWIAFVIFQIPYAPLLAAFIAIANFIPMVGPFIGAVPSILTILLTDPEKAIPFLIIVVLVQQIDSNIITPKIVGDNTGVSALCVLIAIVFTGALWGVVGLLLSVPIFATLLTLVDEFTVSRLQKKGVPSGLENYYADDIIVAPTQDSHAATGSLGRKLERAAIRAKTREEQHEKITGRDRIVRRLYRFLKRHHFFSEVTEDNLTRISAEQTAKLIERDALQELVRIKEEANSAAENTDVQADVPTEEDLAQQPDDTTDAHADAQPEPTTESVVHD